MGVAWSARSRCPPARREAIDGVTPRGGSYDHWWREDCDAACPAPTPICRFFWQLLSQPNFDMPAVWLSLCIVWGRFSFSAFQIQLSDGGMRPHAASAPQLAT